MALFSPVFQQFFDNNGNPLAGGKLYTYEAGTTTNKATYTSEDETTANANPIILDAGGRADIWLESGSYKLVLDDSADVLVDQIDNITGAAANVFGSSVVDVAVNTNVTSVYQNNVIRTTATPITLTLLPAATAGEGFLFSVKNTSAGSNTIDPDAAELIDGNSTLTLAAGASTLIVCDGTGWTSLFIADDILPLDNDFTGDNTFIGKTAYKDAGELTLATGAITITGTSHTVDTEADAAADDLDTITGGANGEILVLRIEDAARVITVKDGTGNIETTGGVDVVLDTLDKTIALQYDLALTKWVVLARPLTVLDEDDLTSDSATAVATQQSIKAYVDAKSVALGTSQASTSGSAIDFSSIPSGTKRITVMFAGVSLSGTDDMLIQLGDAGGFETTGYITSATRATTGVTTKASTAGFIIDAASNTLFLHGALVLTLLDGATNTWVGQGSMSKSGGVSLVIMAGQKPLSAELTQVRITRTGTNTFDAGTININYE